MQPTAIRNSTQKGSTSKMTPRQSIEKSLGLDFTQNEDIQTYRKIRDCARAIIGDLIDSKRSFTSQHPCRQRRAIERLKDEIPQFIPPQLSSLTVRLKGNSVAAREILISICAERVRYHRRKENRKVKAAGGVIKVGRPKSVHQSHIPFLKVRLLKMQTTYRWRKYLRFSRED